MRAPLRLIETAPGDYQVRDADGELIAEDAAFYPIAPDKADMQQLVEAFNAHRLAQEP